MTAIDDLRIIIEDDTLYKAYIDHLYLTARIQKRGVEDLISEIVEEAKKTDQLVIDVADLAVVGLSPITLQDIARKHRYIITEEDQLIIPNVLKKLAKGKVEEVKKEKKGRRKRRKRKEEEEAKKKEEEEEEEEARPPPHPPPPVAARPQRGIPVEKVRTKTEIKREKQALAEKRIAEELTAPRPPITPPTAFDFITHPELKLLVVQIMSDRFAKERWRYAEDYTLADYLLEQTTASYNLGYLDIYFNEWSKYASIGEIARYQGLKLLQYIEDEQVIRIPTKRPRDIVLLPTRIGESIRNWLLVNREEGGSPYEFYRVWRIVKKRTSYAAVARVFHILERLGLIELRHGTRKNYVLFTKEYRGSSAKLYYVIKPGFEADPKWMHPQIALYHSQHHHQRTKKKA